MGDILEKTRDKKYKKPEVLGVYATGFREISYKNVNIYGMKNDQCDVCAVCDVCDVC